MRVLVLVLTIAVLSILSPAFAEESGVKRAYDLYYRGDKEAAITMMEEYVRDNPDPGALYFLGYAYYEKKDMEKAREYFTKSYSMKDFYSPMPTEKSQ
ncbi:MAG: tetratricopeptide repeat protein [Nitrospiraceae bacterium]|nr:MAG: tetratricopeptide repeat protein [Nitrospiraceae bacterium]